MLTAYRELFLTDEELDERQGTALGGMRFQEDCAKIPEKVVLSGVYCASGCF